MNIEPVEGSRDGWAYKTFKAIGTCQVARKDGTTALYHVYGVRDEEIFVQYQGFIDAEGCIWGVSLLASSIDSEAYFWCPRATFERVRIDGETETAEPAAAEVVPLSSREEDDRATA